MTAWDAITKIVHLVALVTLIYMEQHYWGIAVFISLFAEIGRQREKKENKKE